MFVNRPVKCLSKSIQILKSILSPVFIYFFYISILNTFEKYLYLKNNSLNTI